MQIGEFDGNQCFATTHWSVVLAAAQELSPGADQALETLCRTYWHPLYAFVRRQGSTIEDAEDLTQEFFSRFIGKELFRLADPCRGRFRSFLLASFKNFLKERHRHATRLKRGGGKRLIPLDKQIAEDLYLAQTNEHATPETIYERRWAMTLLESAMGRLGAEFTAGGKEQIFDELKGLLWGEMVDTPYSIVAERLEISEGALKVAIHRLRQRFRDLLREEVAQTVADNSQVDKELMYLIKVMRT